MIKNANAYPVSQLLGTDPTITYKIPKYQREYTWSQEQWQYLFDDIVENPNGYFLGSLICVNKSDALQPELEVIDGQQRITTLSILMSALYNQLKVLELNDDQRIELAQLKQKIIKNDRLRITPQTQGQNLDDYKAILKECGLLSTAIRPNHLGNRRLMKAFKYFTNQISNYLGLMKREPLSNGLTEKEIISICEQNEIRIDKDHFNFATKNKSNDFYWINPPFTRLEQDWWLVLNDNINCKLHVLFVPKNELSNSDLKPRGDEKRKEQVDMTIRYNDNHFTERRSKIKFSQFIVKTINYSRESVVADNIDEIQNKKDDVVKLAFGIIEKINNAILVKIEVVSHADAYTLFESLNNRGMPLTAIDLMKNSLLSNAGGNIDNYFENWKEIIDNLGDDYTDQERFFRYYYNAFRDDIKADFEKDTKTLVPVATKSNMLRIYDEIIRNNPSKFINDILSDTKFYAMFLLKENNDDFRFYKNELTNIKNCQGSPAYLLLLYIFKHKETLGLEIKHVNEIISLLAKFFVRRNLTDTPNTRDLTRIFMDIIASLRTERISDIVNYIKDVLINVSASNEMFREKLQSDIYIDNVGMTRYILCRLAEKDMTKENFIDLWKYQENQSKDKYFWTIEHILPQSSKIDSHIHKIGNLTMSGFNSSLSDKSFIEKRDRKNDDKYIGYKNGLNLNADLKNENEWTVEKIEKRSEKLIEQAMELFEL